MDKTVAVFRKYILPYSETFIADQGKFLTEYKPLFCGYSYKASGLSLLGDMPKSVLEDFSSSTEWSKFLCRLGYLNKYWINDIRHHHPALIHAHFLNDGMDSVKLAKTLDVPLITTVHGHDITKPEKSSLLKMSRKDFFDSVDKVIAVSDYIYQHAIKNGCPEEKLIKHSIGIDLEKFKLEKKESDVPELLFVGRLVEKKGCVYLLEAMKRLQKRFEGARLTIVGDGPLRKTLSEIVERDGLNVEFAGKESPESIRQRLSQSWVFVAPSVTAENGDAEGLGMVFLEAQALRTPVVSFRSGGVVEAVEEGETGLLSDERDVDGLYENICYFLENDSQRSAYGSRGRDRVEKNFDIRKQCAMLENIYSGLL